MAFKFGLMILCTLAAAQAQLGGYSRDNPSNQLSYNQGYGSQDQRYQQMNGDEETGGEILGEAGKDYPVYAEVPETRFDCKQQQYPGYYADPEAQCQVFHICQSGGRKDSFLCPNGTLFDQQKLVCVWWYDVDCSQAESFYSINEMIVRAMEEADRLAVQKKSMEGSYRYDTPANDNGYRGASPAGSNDAKNNLNVAMIDTATAPAVRDYPTDRFASQRGPLRGTGPANVFGPPRTFHASAAQTVSAFNERQEGAYAHRQSPRITEATFVKQAAEHNDAEGPAREYLPA